MTGQPRNATVRTLLGHAPYLLALAGAHLWIYREYWSLARLFTGSDFFQLLAPVVNFQCDCVREGSWPLWNPFVNFGVPWVGNYLNSSLFPTHLLISLVTRFDVGLVQREILGWTLLGGAGVYLCAVEEGLSRRAAAVAALSFAFCGQLVALPQWSTLVYNACTFPFALAGFRRARRQRDPLSLTAVFFLSFAILGGYVPATVLGLYFFTGYVALDSLLRRDLKFGGLFLAVTLSLVVLLTLPRLLPLYSALGDSPRLASITSDPRFGIVSPRNFLTYLLPTKFYFSLYLGGLAVLAALYAVFSGRIRLTADLALFVLSAWLLLVGEDGTASLLRRAANATLPFVSLIRLDFIYWFYPSLFAVLFAARHVDGFLAGEARRPSRNAAVAAAAALTAAFLAAYSIPLHYRPFVFHLCALLGWVGLALFVRGGRLQTAGVLALLVLELWVVFARVGIDEPPRRDGPYLDVVLTDQNYISRSLRDDERVRDRMPLRITSDDARPGVDEARQWPYLVPTTPGAPIPNYAEALNRKWFTGWWYNPQETFAFVRLKESPRFASLDRQLLAALVDRDTGSEVPLALTFDRLTCASFSFSSQSAAAGTLVLRQMFDARWKAFVDGREAPVHAAEEFFMGVGVEAGSHRVEFVFRDSQFTAALVVSGATLLSLLATAAWRVRRRRSGPPASEVSSTVARSPSLGP